MLYAYYEHSCGSRVLFANLAIASGPSLEKHMNKYHVIFLNLTCFISEREDDSIMNRMQAIDAGRCRPFWASTSSYFIVARGVDLFHDENTSILSYNDENSFACVLSLAFYYAYNDYIIHRELARARASPTWCSSRARTSLHPPLSSS